jgi:tRNA (adenine57-N1/adenine58-N1)-methyltransferase
MTAANVEEAVARLREIEGRQRHFHAEEEDEDDNDGEKKIMKSKNLPKVNPNSKEKILEGLIDRKMYKEGRLIHRSESEVKTHTSYLVFAILPQEWTEEDEEKARAKWPVKKKAVVENVTKPNGGHVSKRQQKKAARLAQKEKNKDSPEEDDVEPKEEEQDGMDV